MANKKPSKIERERAARAGSHVPIPRGRQSSPPKIAMNKEERNAVVCLRRVLPNGIPEGWADPMEGIRRITDYSSPGSFGQVYVGKGMRLVFSVSSKGQVLISLSTHEGLPTAAGIEEVINDFFPGKEVRTSSAIPGVVYLYPYS